MRSSSQIASWSLAIAATLWLCASARAAKATLDFARDVRPILAENCLRCHGNDPGHREAELRLDQFGADAEGARGAEDVIVPGDVEASEFWSRITSDDADMRMPPADSGKVLKPEQIDVLRRWIESGAEYKPHWSFVPPARPAVPAVSRPDWVRNPIDAFVQARLEQAGLQPSRQADRARLLRRLSLDLIGLPPTPEEVAAFVADENAGAYERQVERLLASPHYGERWGRLWLDAARYADSDGFEKDKPRSVWMYRDWVINALNSDLPYDQFIVEQIAGDMLPGATQEDRVATGFLRNSMINEEGGIDPEQFRNEAMYDRMDAIGKSVLGLTVQCAQCHTHKYDPITHTAYYQMFAFLNNCDESQISVYTPAEREQMETTQKLIRKVEERLKDANTDWRERMAAWEATVGVDATQWHVLRPEVDTSGGQKYQLLNDGSLLAGGYSPPKYSVKFWTEVDAVDVAAFRLELLSDPNLPRNGPGRSREGLLALTELKVLVGPADGSEKPREMKLASATADVLPPQRQLDSKPDPKDPVRTTGPIDLAIDGDQATAWSIDVGPVRSNVPRKAVFVLAEPFKATGRVRIGFQVDQNHGLVDGDVYQNNNFGRFRFSYSGDAKAVADPLPAAVREVLAIPADERTAAQLDCLFAFWRTTVPAFAEANRQIDALWQSHPRGTTQLVLHERSELRKTHRLDRGSFLAPAEEVTPGVPDFLHTLNIDHDGRANRLDFAHWLVDRRSPTTARTAVNRIWQTYFGAGLVRTAEDLGTQGDYPTHPELLDWLAMELMDNGWSFKHIHRLIVSSATYQQASEVTPELLAADPANQLLARGPRFRVDAEVVRDIALAASGLLTSQVGGPSVYPPAPEFLFTPPTSFEPKTWNYDTGPNKYRRALYTTRYRSVLHPALQAFDAPTGEFSCVRRLRSNTPLQALTTLNEPLFLECARALATKAVSEGGDDDDARLRYVFQRSLSRDPEAAELKELEAFLGRQRSRFTAKDAEPMLLLSSSGEPNLALSAGIDAAELAAWTATSRVVLNLDESITKE
jgi:hypothetical protein